MKDEYERIIFPQTVRCTGCGNDLPPAIMCWMVNGHIHCTGCKDKVIQRQKQKEQEQLAQYAKQQIGYGPGGFKSPSAPMPDEFIFPEEFDLNVQS